MAKGKSQPTFGTTVQEIDSSINQMSQEREQIAQKQGTKDFDNKRFEELSSNIELANKQRNSLLPPDTGTPNNTMVEQRTTVPPVQLSNIQSPETITNIVQPQQGSMLGSIAPGTEVVGGQNLTDINAPVNNVSALSQPQFTSPDIPIEQQPQGNTFMQNFLSKIDRTKNDGVEGSINKSIFGQPGQPTKFKPQPLVDIGAEDLFFATGEPILKGMSTGQLTGSRGIYVGGADYFPAQVLNRRKKAIQDAAIAQKQKEQDFLSQRAPLIKDKGFQRSLNETFNSNFNSMVDQAKELYGDNWYDAITDQSTDIGRQYVNFADNMNFLAGSADQATDLIANTRTNMDEGNLVYSPETMQMLDDYENMQGQFAGGDIESLVNLREEFGKMQGFIGLDTYLNDKNVDVKATVTGWANVIDNNDSYITSESKKTAYEDQLRQLAHGWASGSVPSELTPLVRSGLITEDDIFNHLQSLYGYDAVVTTKQVTNKPSGGGGFTINIEGSGETTDKTENIGGVTYEVGYSREISTGGKPMDMSGLSSYDANGNLVREEGVVSMDPNSVQGVKVAVKQPDGSVKYEWKKGIVGTTTIPAEYYPGTNVVKKPAQTTTKLYSWDDNTKKKWMTDNPNMKDQIEQTDKEVTDFVNSKNGQKSKYNLVEEGTTE